MRILRAPAASVALAAILYAPGTASAAWDNVFQVTCNCSPRTSGFLSPSYSVGYAAAPCCPTPCCPQTAYVQRSYYQPVTCYRPVVTNEPVVSYRTSYYWEPLTTCSYSCYVDPCTGCSTQVATPSVSYRLRSQCNAVTSYVQRVCYQPVTTLRQSFYYEPVTVMPPSCPPLAAAPILSVPGPVTNPPVTINPPTTTESTVTPPQSPAPPLNLPQDNRTMPGANSYRMPVSPNTPLPVPVAPTATAPRPDQIASTGGMTGTVVKNVNSNFQPLPGARLRFVSTQDMTRQQVVTADGAGHFQVSLIPGAWKLFMDDTHGQPVLHSQVDVKSNDTRLVTLVSR